MLQKWWNHRERAPLTEQMIPETTWILSIDGIPALCLSLILTNAKAFCLLENFIGNPDLDGSPERHAAASNLVEYLENVARALGYQTTLCFAYRPKLETRYSELGYSRSVDAVSFVKCLTKEPMKRVG